MFHPAFFATTYFFSTRFQILVRAWNWLPWMLQIQKHWQTRRLGDLNPIGDVPDQDYVRNPRNNLFCFAYPSNIGSRILLREPPRLVVNSLPSPPYFTRVYNFHPHAGFCTRRLLVDYMNMVDTGDGHNWATPKPYFPAPGPLTLISEPGAPQNRSGTSLKAFGVFFCIELAYGNKYKHHINDKIQTFLNFYNLRIVLPSVGENTC